MHLADHADEIVRERVLQQIGRGARLSARWMSSSPWYIVSTTMRAAGDVADRADGVDAARLPERRSMSVMSGRAVEIGDGLVGGRRHRHDHHVGLAR